MKLAQVSIDIAKMKTFHRENKRSHRPKENIICKKKIVNQKETTNGKMLKEKNQKKKRKRFRNQSKNKHISSIRINGNTIPSQKFNLQRKSQTIQNIRKLPKKIHKIKSKK